MWNSLIYIFSKNYSFTPNRLVRLQEAGVLEKIIMEDVRHAKECLKPMSSAVLNSLRALELGDFYGVFSVYVGGKHYSSYSFTPEEIIPLKHITGKRDALNIISPLPHPKLNFV